MELYLEDAISKEEYLKGRERIQKETEGSVYGETVVKTEAKRKIETDILSEAQRELLAEKIITKALIQRMETLKVGENGEICIHFRDLREKEEDFRE